MTAIREAKDDDNLMICNLLRQHDLRPEGVLESGTKYWVAEEGVDLIGAIGLELGQASVLLRSAIVDSHRRGKGIGRQLTEYALDWARLGGYRKAYCFSTDAGGYWVTRGFRACPVEEVVNALPTAPQVKLFHRLGWLPTEVAYEITII